MLPPLFIDTHEPKDIIQMFVDKGYDVRVQTLPVGDYVIGDMGWERKYTDFLNFEDVLTKTKELQSSYSYPKLIVELSMEKLLELSKKYGNPKWKEAMFFGLVGSLTECGVPPIFTGNRRILVETMHTTIKKHFDGINRNVPTEIAQKRVATDKDSLFGMYLNLPMVGDGLAKLLLEHFPTLESLLSAKREDFMAIHGIADGRANKLYEFLHK